jgi:hypothetical protein
MERRGNIFNEMCFVPLLEEEEGDMGEENPSYTQFLLFPNSGISRGGETSYLITISIILMYLSSYLF